jgi:hypothetical protein
MNLHRKGRHTTWYFASQEGSALLEFVVVHEAVEYVR